MYALNTVRDYSAHDPWSPPKIRTFSSSLHPDTGVNAFLAKDGIHPLAISATTMTYDPASDEYVFVCSVVYQESAH